MTNDIFDLRLLMLFISQITNFKGKNKQQKLFWMLKYESGHSPLSKIIYQSQKYQAYFLVSQVSLRLKPGKQEKLQWEEPLPFKVSKLFSKKLFSPYKKSTKAQPNRRWNSHPAGMIVSAWTPISVLSLQLRTLQGSHYFLECFDVTDIAIAFSACKSRR